jgi:recombinational DNA repair ATPase RecF
VILTIRIKKIRIKAFRGIPNLELELDGKSLVLRGENGTGKSSLIDSIEFFFTGRVMHLEGVRGLSLKEHGPHVNFSHGDVDVDITFDPGNVTLTRTFASAPSPPRHLKDYFETAQTGTFILRRAQVLEFIESQPAERFRAIGNIIGLGDLDNIELEMMRARDDLSGKVESNKGDIQRLLSGLIEVLGGDIRTVRDVVPALNKILRKEKLPLINSLEEAGKHAEEMLKTVKKTISIDQISLLNKMIGDTRTDLITEDFVNRLTGFNSKVKKLLQEETTRKISLIGLLEIGRKIIEQGRLDECPICEQKIDRERVLSRLSERVSLVEALSKEASQVRSASVPILDILKGTIARMQSIASTIESFDQLSGERNRIQEALQSLRTLNDEILAAKDLDGEVSISTLTDQKNSINNLIATLSKSCQELLDHIDLTNEEKKLLQIVRLIEQVRTKTEELSRIESEKLENERRFNLAEKIYSTFSATKKSKIQGVYSNIQEDIQKFYSMLHPNDPHKNIQLIVALGRRASTELKIESFGRMGEDPRALTSEGHLDSLGLCVFLAFVKRFDTDCSLIVLDDVVNTIDSGHRDNICKLLLEEFQDKQLLITTLDGVWYEQLRASQHAYGLEGNFKNMIIIDWDVSAGPRIRGYKPRWEKIQEDISTGDRTSAGNEGRQYLEWILEQICEVTEAPVPFRSSRRYEIRDLLVPARKRLDSLIAEDGFKTTMSESFRELERTIIMGNLLSHNNVLVEEVSMSEVKGFCEAVNNLHNAFSCPNCKHLLGYYRDLGILRCSNTRCKNPVEVKTK